MKKLQDIEQEIDSHTLALTSLIPARDYLKKKTTLGMVKHNGKWIKWGEYEQEIWQDGYNTKISITDKITWVLTAVNVAILISLVIRNV